MQETDAPKTGVTDMCVRWGTYQVGTRDGQTGFTIVYMYRTHQVKIWSDATAYVREYNGEDLKWDILYR